MTEIRYWDAAKQLGSADTTKREQVTKVNEINETFNKQMYDLIMSSSTDDSLFDVFDSEIPDSLFGDDSLDSLLDSKLSNLKNEGMEKVWAAKMANALPFSDMDMGYGKKDNNSSMGGLDSFIELTVKAQMARAKKNLEHDLRGNSHMSLEQFIGKETVSNDRAVAPDSDTPELFIQNMQSQIENAAEKFDMSAKELAELILSQK